MLEKPGGSRSAGSAQQELRIRAAWIYYVEGKTQLETANVLGLSRVAVTRLLSEARSRNEVAVRIHSELKSLVDLARRVESRFGLREAIIAPFSDRGGDPTRAIAAAAGEFLSRTVKSNMAIGVGWGRTLHAALEFVDGRPLANTRILSLLGGISEAKRFNPAEFAWRFAELFDAEGFLVPAPALVDSPETRDALLERCGLGGIFEMAEASDIAIVSCGDMSPRTTSFRTGYMSEAERLSLIAAGAVGDVLCQFIDADGRIVDHPLNRRFIAIGLKRLRRVMRTVLVSGGPEKTAVLLAALKVLSPTVLITDEVTASALLEEGEAP